MFGTSYIPYYTKRLDSPHSFYLPVSIQVYLYLKALQLVHRTFHRNFFPTGNNVDVDTFISICRYYVTNQIPSIQTQITKRVCLRYLRSLHSHLEPQQFDISSIPQDYTFLAKTSFSTSLDIFHFHVCHSTLHLFPLYLTNIVDCWMYSSLCPILMFCCLLT